MVLSFSNRRFPIALVGVLFPFLSFCCYMHAVQADFLAEPTLKWSLQLQGSGRNSGRGLRKGNGIVADKDGTKIVVTTNDGSLHIIQTTNQVRSLAVYIPNVKDGKTLECRSGATIVYKKQQGGLTLPRNSEEEESVPSKEDFIVYAVVDNAGDVTTSRVIAVNMEGILKWTVDVDGRIEGTPLVGKTGIYVTHNIDNMGYLSILRIQPKNGTAVIEATVGTSATPWYRKTPLSPPALRKPAFGEDESDANDVVIVAESWDAEDSGSGGLHMLATRRKSTTDEKDEKTISETASMYDYELIKISSWSNSFSAPPQVLGDSIFVGTTGGIIGGFTGNRKNDLSGISSGREEEISPRWSYQVSTNPQNASESLQNQPVLDSEGEYLLVAGGDSDFYCLQSDSGRELWRDDEGSQILARPQVFEEDWRKVVYVIETQNGRIRQYDLYSGRRYWDYSCADISKQLCQDAVEAEFAITSSGNTIYYGDIFGRINSLEVAKFATETPTIAPSPSPTESPSGYPTTSSAPSGASIPTQLPQVPPDTLNPIFNAGAPTGSTVTNGGDVGQQIVQDGGDNNDKSSEFTGAISSNAESSAVLDQLESQKDSNKVAAYIGAAIAGLCILMTPIVLLSMLRRRRKKPTASQDMVVEIIDDCSLDDVESQTDLDHFNSIATNNSYDPYNGDAIEVEIVSHSVSPRVNSKKKKKKRKKRNLPDTPNTINSLESIEEIPEDASAVVVMGESNETDPSVEAVNLRQTFDRVADSRKVSPGDVLLGAGSNHLELSVGNIDGDGHNVNDSGYSSEDDLPPPPPPPEDAPESPSSKEWTWSSLLQIGASQSSKKPNSSSQIPNETNSQKLELKQPGRAISSSQEESSISTGSHNDISADDRTSAQKETLLPTKKMKWKKKNKKSPRSSSPEIQKNVAENVYDELSSPMDQEQRPENERIEESMEESASKEAVVAKSTNDESETPIGDIAEESAKISEVEEEEEIDLEPHTSQSSIPVPETPASPSTYAMLSDTVDSPVRSVNSIQESLFNSPNRSTSRSVGSDDDSLYTSYTGMAGETPEKKSVIKELSPLSNYVYDQDIHRRDRSEIFNEGKGSLVHPVLSKTRAEISEEEHPDDESAFGQGTQKYGRSVRSKRDSNSFRSGNSTGNETGHTPLAEMYDQLAAIGQQRREAKKPAFKRRNKRAERENLSTPTQQENDQGDTWGSFLNELAEAEKQFFSPSTSKSKSLSNDGDSEACDNE